MKDYVHHTLERTLFHGGFPPCTLMVVKTSTCCSNRSVNITDRRLSNLSKLQSCTWREYWRVFPGGRWGVLSVDKVLVRATSTGEGLRTRGQGPGVRSARNPPNIGMKH